MNKQWVHTLAEFIGFMVMMFTFAWYLSARISTLEVKVDLLMEGKVNTSERVR
jgi:hypothetical protein